MTPSTAMSSSTPTAPLTQTEARTLLAVRMIANDPQGDGFARTKQIAEALGVTLTWAGHGLRSLERLGHIEGHLLGGGFLGYRETRP